MPVVPNDVWFCPNDPINWTPLTSSNSFGDVRAMPDQQKLEALKRRPDHILVGQVNSLFKIRNWDLQPDMPQILATLSCVALATIGRVFFLTLRNGGPSHHDGEEFVKACEGIDPGLAVAWTYPNTDIEGPLRITTPQKHTHSWVLYSGFRSGLIHSYATSGVYLENQLKPAPPWKENGPQYHLVVHPDPFWRMINDRYLEIWDDVLNNAGDPRRQSALNYLTEILQ